MAVLTTIVLLGCFVGIYASGALQTRNTTFKYLKAFKMRVQSQEAYKQQIDWATEPWPVHIAAENRRSVLVCGKIRSGEDSGAIYAIQYTKNMWGAVIANELNTPAHSGAPMLPECNLVNVEKERN